MTFVEKLQKASEQNHSMLCVGLDPDIQRLPKPYQGRVDKILDFCMAVVDVTTDLVIAYKPQVAYFSACGAEDALEKLIQYIHQVAPQVPVILDAKRGDIGSTATQYAKEAFIRYQADAVTLSPYMGFDSITPYLEYEDKGLFLLCRTSNQGGDALQAMRLADTPGQKTLYEYVAYCVQNHWNKNGQMGLVVGATYPTELAKVRAIAPQLPLLIPGVGTQGGDLDAVVKAAWRGTQAPLVVNVSRAILYAGESLDFAASSRRVAEGFRNQLEQACPKKRLTNYCAN